MEFEAQILLCLLMKIHQCLNLLRKLRHAELGSFERCVCVWVGGGYL